MFTALRDIAARARALFRSPDLDRDLAQELESHLAMLTEDNIRRGMPPDQARRAALIRMGGPQSIREQHRVVRGLPAVETVLQDLRFAFRLIAKDRWFSAAVIVVLALGIGANTIGFTIVHAAFLRGLPFEEADRLYVVSLTNRAGRRSNVSRSELQDWRDRSRTFAGLAGYRDATMNISDDRALPELANGTWLTANTFGVLRQQPLLGRDFAAGDERAGAEPVAIIGYTPLEEPVRQRSERPRQDDSHQRAAHDDHRRDARQDAIPRQLPGLGPLRADGGPEAAGRSCAAGVRSIAGRHGAPGSAGGNERHRRAAQSGVPGGDQGSRRCPRGNVHGAVHRGRRAADAHDGDGRRRVRAAHRLRERRQPAALALGLPGAGDRRPDRHGRHALESRAAAPARERRARVHRREHRAAPGRRRRERVRDRDPTRRAAVLGRLLRGLRRVHVRRARSAC